MISEGPDRQLVQINRWPIAMASKTEFGILADMYDQAGPGEPRLHIANLTGKIHSFHSIPVSSHNEIRVERSGPSPAITRRHSRNLSLICAKARNSVSMLFSRQAPNCKNQRPADGIDFRHSPDRVGNHKGAHPALVV